VIAIGLRNSLQKQIAARMCNSLADIENMNEREELLVDSATVDQSELYSFRQQHPDCVLTYIVDDINQTMTAFAAAHNIRLVQPQKLSSYLSEQESTRHQVPILAFWGVYPRLGTTTIALSVAHVLASQHGKSVGVLGLNAYNPGNWPLHERNHHLDDITSFLLHKKVDRETLLSVMESAYRVKYLPGMRNQTQALILQPEHVDSLLETASSLFEVLVLDLGSILNTALALQGMKCATHRYVVANDLVSTQRQFFDHLDYVLKPLGIKQDELMLVGSQLHGKGTGFAKAVGLVLLAGIPFFPSIDLYAEQQAEPLKLFLGEKQFRKAVETIAQSACVPTEAGVAQHVRA
jgi:Flp pilus assembly CpaE family ATPase